MVRETIPGSYFFVCVVCVTNGSTSHTRSPWMTCMFVSSLHKQYCLSSTLRDSYISSSWIDRSPRLSPFERTSLDFLSILLKHADFSPPTRPSLSSRLLLSYLLLWRLPSTRHVRHVPCLSVGHTTYTSCVAPSDFLDLHGRLDRILPTQTWRSNYPSVILGWSKIWSTPPTLYLSKQSNTLFQNKPRQRSLIVTFIFTYLLEFTRNGTHITHELFIISGVFHTYTHTQLVPS